jgi:arginyl-tRNA synthetase
MHRATFELAERIMPTCGARCRHVNFGRILGMSTRRGTAVMLAGILDEARDRMAVQQDLSPSKSHFSQTWLLSFNDGVTNVLTPIDYRCDDEK